MSLVGQWRMVEMDLWDREAMDLLGPAVIELHGNGTGRFRFIAVEGHLDCRDSERHGRPGVEFTWEGDDGDPASGSWLGGPGGGRLVAWSHLLPPR
ncbi:MAG: hypothetical protein ACRD29_03820 [Acidimicrobiales bacterium]